MMITEQNCEEYFLLYIDNELSAAERKAVDDFVALHPQHSALFSSLQDTKLPLEGGLSFFSKEDLYKDETAEIGINNYEEYFLLYTDNELSKEQKQTTERFVLQHPQLQEEFTLLQQTKLQPEVIGYRNKKELYKKERRVLPLYIMGTSVAAAVMGVLFLTGTFTPKQNGGNTLAATTVKQVDKTASKPEQPDVFSSNITKHPEQQTEASIPVAQSVKTIGEKNRNVASTAHNIETQEEHSVPAIHHLHEEEVAVAPVPDEKQIIQPSSPDNKLIAAKQVSILKPLEEYNADQTNTTTAMSLSDDNIAHPAVYKELNTDDDDHTLYVSGLPINKNKVNGFLKSASRLLGSHTRQSEE